ncbi:MAG: hypothetical protein IKD42_04440 [Kiritimatiellae bacterium]|nr:hypothetical protein [Kiritimatiellia bacterium]
MKIHFTGIGGVGMAALAVLAKNRGHDVDGCDLKPSARTAWLESQGIRVSFGHDPAHVAEADMVVATAALARDNPETAAARGVLVRRGEALADIVSSCDSIAVAGTHGKTTTSVFTAKLLIALGESVEWAIGGECGDFPVAGKREGRGTSVLVVEADESDGTLALYSPSILVVTNCEYDHPDHFKTPAAYFECFDTARGRAKRVIESGALGDFPPEMLSVCADAVASLAPHNRLNARAAVEAALLRGHSPAEIAAVFPKAVSSLPDRRFEPVAPGVYTDYAHHPSEIRCAVAMARECARGGRLRILFQPHRYSRTKALLGDFPAAFAQADEVVLCPTYAAFEKPVEGGGVCDLYAACREYSGKNGGPEFLLARNLDEAWTHARLSSARNDIVLLLGAGDIISLAARAKEDAARARSAHEWTPLAGFSFFRTGGRSAGGGAVHTAGMGSNLWISDLATDDVYKRSAAPAARAGSSLGIPWMAGVPGSVGGWVKMNAGAFGHSVSEVVSRVKASGRWIGRDECGFGYRTSAIAGEIEDVEFDEAALAKARSEGNAGEYLSRRKKFPARCCGSVFKNPAGGKTAGELLEAAGAKGMRVGGAYVWEGHANVIAAGDGANSSDILALVWILREKVRFRFGVSLEPEVSGLFLDGE